MADYVPPADASQWEQAEPAEAGFDAAALADAVRFAEAHETPWPHDIPAMLAAGHFEPPPDNEVLGPTAPRGDPNGLLLKGGRIVARWGDTRRVDMTFSVAKSCLNILAGLAHADGLIADLDAPIGASVHDGGFEGPHNGAITWRQMMQQTSEWEGTLFGKSDRIDRNRDVGSGPTSGDKGAERPLDPPGSYWEYNDARVNRFSLALLRRFGRALPEVFAERIAGPIGCSDSWIWRGYRTSTVEVGGKPVESVSGGGHWGGGMFIHAEDLARLGLLMARGGRWGKCRLLAASWVAATRAPVALNPAYGLLWWLNTDHCYKPNAPADSFFAIGAGGNVIWVAPSDDLVAVLRWIDPDALDGWISRVLAARHR